MTRPPSRAEIRRFVGATYYARGERYQQAGEVIELTLDGDALYATVQGTRAEPYSVRVWFDEEGRPSSSTCSCPLGGACKHVAAALLAWVEQPRGVSRPAPAVQPATEGGAPSSVPHASMPVDQLEAWAREKGVLYALRARAAELPDVPREIRSWFWYAPFGTTVADVISATTNPKGSLRPGAGTVPAALQEVAIAFLRGQALQAEKARAFEQEAESWRSRPPEDPPLRRLWEQLRAARAELRKDAEPRKLDPKDPGVLKVEEDPPIIRYIESTAKPCGAGERVEVVVMLQAGPGESAVRCACIGPRRPGCPYALSAADAVLDRLTKVDSSRIISAARLAMNTAPWERALGHLDQVLAQHGIAAAARSDDDPEGREPGWQVSFNGGLQLRPVLVRPFARKEGMRSWNASLADFAARPHALPLEADRRAVQLLSRASDSEEGISAVREALLVLEGHPRVIDEEGRLVRVRRGSIRLHWSVTPDGGLHMALADGENVLSEDLARTLVYMAQSRHWFSWKDGARVTVAPLQPGAWELLHALQQRGWSYPPEAVPPLLDRVEGIARMIPVTLDEGLRGVEIDADRRPLLRLEPTADAALVIDLRSRPLHDGPAFPPGEGPDEIYAVRPEGRVFARRYLEGEPDEVAERLEGIPGLELPMPGWRRVIENIDLSLDLVAWLQDHKDELQVEWNGRPRKVSRPANGADLRVEVKDRRDWLGLGGRMQVDGLVIELGALLAAIREGRRYVKADEDAYVRISSKLRQGLEAAAAATFEGRSGLELSPLAGMALESLADEGVDLDIPETWTVRRDALREAARLEISVPTTLKAELRPYQLQGFQWMARLAHWAPGACLADDMGLGKTVQALALLLRRAEGGPALVVAPTSVGFNWRTEARRFAPGLKLQMYRERGRGSLLRDLGPGQVLITSYDIVARDAEALSTVRWHTLVLDEAQAIKNPGTQRAKTVHSLQADFSLALTGTPIENRTGELWSLFRSIAPGLLGSAERFRERFAVPIERHQDPHRQAALSELIRPFLLRRLKSQVAPELPERTEQVVTVELSTAERRLYERARLEAIAELAAPSAEGGDHRFQVLAALTRLRQLACHPKLDDPDSDVPSAKLDALLELIDEVHEGGHKALVFSQFTRHLGIVREALQKMGLRLLYLDGSTPAAERPALVEAFQRGNADVFLISLKAGGTGLNLTAATYVFHLDPWWNPAVEDQATDRAHRIGQQEPVTVYRLVASNTVEEAIIALHGEKRALMEGILSGTLSAGKLETEELLRILREHGEALVQ